MKTRIVLKTYCLLDIELFLMKMPTPSFLSLAKNNHLEQEVMFKDISSY